MLELSESEKYRSMTNAELLSIVLCSDYKTMEKCAHALFEDDRTYNTAVELSRKAEVETKDAERMLAIAELMKRRPGSQRKQSLSSSILVYNYVAETLKGLDHEEIFCLYMNNANYPIKLVRFGVGTYNCVTIDVRQVLREALELKATGMILIHNHPSGKLTPSEQDRQLTRKIQEAGEVMDIKLLDHLIVGEDRYYSFNDAGDIV